jgi:hypothetical protein
MERIRDHHDIDPDNETNVDETGVQEGEDTPGIMVKTSRTRRSRIKKSPVITWVFFIEYIRLVGGKFITVIIFAGKII